MNSDSSLIEAMARAIHKVEREAPVGGLRWDALDNQEQETYRLFGWAALTALRDQGWVVVKEADLRALEETAEEHAHCWVLAEEGLGKP